MFSRGEKTLNINDFAEAKKKRASEEIQCDHLKCDSDENG